MSTTREEHLEWCKQRALDYLKTGDTQNAFSSFQSDMMAHPETISHLALEMGTMLLISGHLSTVSKMREWIESFN